MKLLAGRALAALALSSVVACSTSDEDDRGISPAPDASADSGADAGPVDFGLGVYDSGTDGDGGVADSGTADSGQSDAAVIGPIVAPALTWTWVPIPDSRCINNQPTGFGININPASTKLAIFMEGGNACFNPGSCTITANLDGYNATKFARDVPSLNSAGFDRVANENYFKDWSYVYIPYCSGDTYSGTIGTTTIQGTTYTFKGFDNVGLFLERIVPTFPNVTDVLLTGVSAGGFGSFANYDQVATAFGPSINVTLIDDSGPPMSGDYVPGCLQTHFRAVWGLDNGPLAACGAACVGADGTFLVQYMEYMLDKYPNRNFGVISSSQDQTIRNFWGYGNNNCAELVAGFFPPAYTGARYQAGLESLRDDVFMAHDNAKLYMPFNTRHIWTHSPTWTINEQGVILQDWMIQALEDNAAWANVP